MDDDRKSRTQKKNEDRALQDLGKQLVALSLEQLEHIDMPEELLKEVLIARKTKKRGAKRRQMQYIGAIMRKIDPEPVRDALENFRLGDLEKARAFHKLEAWRDQIREGNTRIIEEILRSCPQGERQRLEQLARNARKEYETKKGVKSSRMLFRYLRDIAGA